MADSLVERALAAIESRLATVLTSGGYNTNAGQRVYRAKTGIQNADLPCFVVWKQSEEDAPGGDKSTVQITIAIECLVQADQAGTGRELEKIEADAKQAVGLNSQFGLRDGNNPSDKIGDIAKTGVTASPRKEGSKSESVSVNYLVTIIEGIGNPYGSTAGVQTS